jgi:hypothetical protein
MRPWRPDRLWREGFEIVWANRGTSARDLSPSESATILPALLPPRKNSFPSESPATAFFSFLGRNAGSVGRGIAGVAEGPPCAGGVAAETVQQRKRRSCEPLRQLRYSPWWW